MRNVAPTNTQILGPSNITMRNIQILEHRDDKYSNIAMANTQTSIFTSSSTQILKRHHHRQHYQYANRFSHQQRHYRHPHHEVNRGNNNIILDTNNIEQQHTRSLQSYSSLNTLLRKEQMTRLHDLNLLEYP